VSKYYVRDLGRLRRRDKPSDRSEGAASDVRYIDPAGYVPPPPKPETVRPRSEAEADSARRRWLSRQAFGLTGIKVVSGKQTFDRHTRKREGEGK
jgi:hypothetical protein